MSTTGRGRGYTGRHHLRETRPGDQQNNEELEAVRTLSELNPRSTDQKLDLMKMEARMKEPPLDVYEKESEDPKAHLSKDDEVAMQELLTVDEQFTPLLILLEQFSPGEDGIQFNRKLKNFETTITNMCPDEMKLQQAFSSFRAASLQSSVTARKLAAVSASFTRQQRQQLLRRVLLDVVMEGTFNNIEVLERSNPIYLINAANLMGDYFAEARLCNGNKVHVLAAPLLQYMKSLLASDDIRAHRSLATQLMQNGRELLSVLSHEVDELSILIRARLLTPPPVSIIWLLLSADLCLNKFLPLPNTLQHFYASHLDLTSDENYCEVSYGSWKNSQEKEELNQSDVSTTSNMEKVAHNLSQISLNSESEIMKPKLRPILGAGAAKVKQDQITVSQDNFETWTPKSLSKRYDLNSWRQTEEEVKSEEIEPVFDPSVLPPNMQPTYSVIVPNYPPPIVPAFNSYSQEPPANYLQKGDGAYIQNQYQSNANFSSHGDGLISPPSHNQNAQTVEKVNSEIQKGSRKPTENWRKEKSDIKEGDLNQSRSRNWNQHHSNESVNNEDETEKDDVRSLSRNSRDSRTSGGRVNNRRNSSEHSDGNKPAARRHVSDVPRNHKYWDHDDRCDKDYAS